MLQLYLTVTKNSYQINLLRENFTILHQQLDGFFNPFRWLFNIQVPVWVVTIEIVMYYNKHNNILIYCNNIKILQLTWYQSCCYRINQHYKSYQLINYSTPSDQSDLSSTVLWYKSFLTHSFQWMVYILLRNLVTRVILSLAGSSARVHFQASELTLEQMKVCCSVFILSHSLCALRAVFSLSAWNLLKCPLISFATVSSPCLRVDLRISLCFPFFFYLFTHRQIQSEIYILINTINAFYRRMVLTPRSYWR